MNTSALLGELTELGIEVWAAGDRLLYKPRSAVGPELLERLKAHKEQILRAYGQHGDHRHDLPVDGADADHLLAGAVVEARSDWVAVRLHSKLLTRDVWLARDAGVAAELSVEFPGVPVLTFEEIGRLEGMPVELIRVIVETKSIFPNAAVRA